MPQEDCVMPPRHDEAALTMMATPPILPGSNLNAIEIGRRPPRAAAADDMARGFFAAAKAACQCSPILIAQLRHYCLAAIFDISGRDVQ